VAVLKWVKVRATPDQPHAIITAPEVATDHGVPRNVLKEYLEREVEESAACWGLPFTLLLVVSYAIVALSHDDAAMLRALEQSMAHDIVDNANFAFTGPAVGNKGLDDVNSVADFWSWMSNGLLPLIFIQSKSWHENYNETDQWYENQTVSEEMTGVWLTYNRIVGGIRMRQETDENIDCTTVEINLKAYGMSCVGGLGFELDPEIRSARFISEPVREVWLYLQDDLEHLQDVVWELERTRWLDRNTREIEIAIPVYNGELGIHVMFYIGFFMNRGGHIYKKLMPMSITSQMHPFWYYWIGDFVWMFCVFYIFISEIGEVWSIVKRKGITALAEEYVSFWNLFDWFSLFCAFVVMGMFGSVMNMVNICNDSVQNLKDPTEVLWNSTAYTTVLHDHIETLETTVKYVNNFRTVMAAYPLIIILRLFKAYSAQPRLAMVTKTLETAGQELIEFGLVFMSVFVTFTISGVVLFGREVVSFGTMPRAVFASFRMLIGDLMWDEISQVGRVFAFMWISLFMVVNVMLLLNMLLAIIMKHYVQAKDSAGNAQTLWSEAFQVWERWRDERKGRTVAIEKILSVLEKEDRIERQLLLLNPDEEDIHIEDEEELELNLLGRVLTAQDMMKSYATHAKGGPLSEEQILTLMELATTDFYNAHHSALDMEEVLKMTHKVEYRCQKLNKMSKLLDRKNACPNELEATRDFLKEVETFTDELRAECKSHKGEVEELRTLKRGLLLQLQTRQSLDPRLQDQDIAQEESATLVTTLMDTADPPSYHWKLASRFVGEGHASAPQKPRSQFAQPAEVDTEISIDFDELIVAPGPAGRLASTAPIATRQPRKAIEDPYSDDEDNNLTVTSSSLTAGGGGGYEKRSGSI